MEAVKKTNTPNAAWVAIAQGLQSEISRESAFEAQNKANDRGLWIRPCAGNWVDFKAIKAAVTMEMILGRYGVNWLRKKDDELRGRCPIHQGEVQSTFHASLTKNVFNCFSCKARGNVL